MPWWCVGLIVLFALFGVLVSIVVVIVSLTDKGKPLERWATCDTCQEHYDDCSCHEHIYEEDEKYEDDEVSIE